MSSSDPTDTKLDALLDQYNIAPASDLLSARILKAARATSQEVPASQITLPKTDNDRAPGPWIRMAALVLVTATLGIGTLAYQSQSPQENLDETVWLEAATDLGVSDIYDWVEGEDSKSSAS